MDFPIALFINDTAGPGDHDLSDIFDDLRDTTLSYCNDDFSDNDGDINRDKWYYSGLGGPTYMREDSNKLKINFATNYVKMRSQYGLQGDFDVQIDFDVTGAVHTNGWYVGFILTAVSGSPYVDLALL